MGVLLARYGAKWKVRTNAADMPNPNPSEGAGEGGTKRG
ncbi:hypothetical protein CFELI_13165 [Corynebacterium felinum]|uniref:Uncharacterized protein n=1 Tax=Corynebacterium felinum TaxID=131318 RepID=A0ABU2B600_9CORY|nr:hypothetical protein [Corynebacterium felinum]WJY96212.1 hypothetical protein CFELI_13165 [Corynebacterium felinum]